MSSLPAERAVGNRSPNHFGVYPPLVNSIVGEMEPVRSGRMVLRVGLSEW